MIRFHRTLEAILGLGRAARPQFFAAADRTNQRIYPQSEFLHRHAEVGVPYGFASICMLLLQIYLSCSIGQLFKRHRILWSVLVYYGINVLIELLSVSGLIGFNAFSAFAYTATVAKLNMLLGIVLAVQAALCVLYFFLSECILRKKLNLE